MRFMALRAGRKTGGIGCSVVILLLAGLLPAGDATTRADRAPAGRPESALARSQPPGKAAGPRPSKRAARDRTAQDRPRRDARPRPARKPAQKNEDEGRRRPSRRRPRGRALRANPFRPAPQDLGPLRQGEADQLLRFARQRMPHVYDALQRLREQNRQRFDRRLRELAPRLRQLRRLFDEDPSLAELLVEHITRVEQLNRIRMFVARNRNRPELLRRAAGEVRRIMADLRRIEMDVLQHRIRQLTRNRDTLVEEDFARLTDPASDLLDEPPEIRRIVGRLRRTVSDRERAAIEQQLRSVCQRRIDERIRMLRERVQRMRRDAPAEIDRRVRKFIENARHKREHDVP